MSFDPRKSTKFPGLGSEEKRPEEVFRGVIDRDLQRFEGMIIESEQKIFDIAGNVIDQLVTEFKLFDDLGKVIAANFNVANKELTAWDKEISIFQDALKQVGLEQLTNNMFQATDSATRFAKVLELMQQNLDANVAVASSVVKRDKASEAAKKKRDKERDKSILGISDAAIALKLFNKAITPFKQGIGAVEAGFNKNTQVIFSALENLGEALGRPFLDTFETWAGAIDDVTDGVLTRQDAWDAFGGSINEISDIFNEFPDLKTEFADNFRVLRDLLLQFQVVGVSAGTEQQFLTATAEAVALLTAVEEARDDPIVEEIQNTNTLLENLINIIEINGGGGAVGGLSSQTRLFAGLFD